MPNHCCTRSHVLIWAIFPRQLQGFSTRKMSTLSSLAIAFLCGCPSLKVLHTHLQDFDTAGPLYDTALKLSGENPLVQRACGLFLLSSCRFPREQSRSKGLALLSAAEYRYGVTGGCCASFSRGACCWHNTCRCFSLQQCNPSYRTSANSNPPRRGIGYINTSRH